MAFDEQQVFGEPPGGDVEGREGAGVIAEGDIRAQSRLAVERRDARCPQPRRGRFVETASLAPLPARDASSASGPGIDPAERLDTRRGGEARVRTCRSGWGAVH